MKFHLVENFDKIRYSYNGPVYGDNGLIAKEVKKSTYAKSKNEAARNIKYQLLKELGVRVDIDVSRIYSLLKIDDKVANKIDNKSPEQLSMF